MEKLIDKKCPGDDPTARAVPEMFACPHCGAEVEIWSDESRGTCPGCKKKVQKSEALKKG